jgi:hypothetical protein
MTLRLEMTRHGIAHHAKSEECNLRHRLLPEYSAGSSASRGKVDPVFHDLWFGNDTEAKATLSRHHRPRAGDPDCVKRCAFRIETAGLVPAMTAEGNNALT